LFGYGPGVALYHFSGNPIFYTPQPNGKILAHFDADLRYHSAVSVPDLALAVPLRQLGPAVHRQSLSGRKVNGFNTSYEDYGLGLAYNLHF